MWEPPKPLSPYEKAEAVVHGWLGLCRQETMISGQETLVQLIEAAIEYERLKSEK